MDAHLNIKSSTSFCFNKDDFISNDFSVDRFVSECRKYASLDTMRDDLSMYQKILCSAMIELINKDYADFVNLSSNLVGLDKSIKSLSLPLQSLKCEVSEIKDSFNSTLNNTQKILSDRESSHESKVLIYHIISVQEGLEKITHLEAKISESGVDFETLERIALIFNSLQFHTETIADLSNHDYKKELVTEVEHNLIQRLEFALLQNLLKHNVPNLQKVLQIYAVMSKEKMAEECFRQNIVKPFLKNIMTKNYISKVGLEKTLDELLDFISNSCCDVLKITRGTNREVEIVPGYDFLVNAVWPEIFTSFEYISPLYLYSLGDPFELFHRNYNSSMRFLDKFEHQCASQSSVRRLRECCSYKEFIEKWNLDVYFEIRFQEIAGEFEAALLEPTIKSNDDSSFVLKVTAVLWTCLNHCWSEQIFLPFLNNSFLKLTFQLMSRYRKWALCSLKEKNDSTIRVVYLVNDIEILVSKLTSFFPQIVYPKLGSDSSNHYIEAAVKESIRYFEEISVEAGKVTINLLTDKCSSHLKLIASIPQRFRKTNREIPSKPSPYVSQVIGHVTEFLSEAESLLPSKWCRHCQLQIIDEILKQCIIHMKDVLTSIKKMEDSLKILKRARDKPAGQFTSGAVSDDDKIRRQLAIDVGHFEELILQSGLEIDDLKSLQDLKNLVISAERSSSNQVNS